MAEMNDCVGVKRVGQRPDGLGLMAVGTVIDIFYQFPGQRTERVIRV